MRSINLYLNIILSLFFIWYFGFQKCVVYYFKYISPKETFLDNVYYKAKVDAYESLNEKLTSNREHVVFVGDSIIEYFPINEILSEKDVLNRGIGFDTTIGVLKRLERNINNIKISRLFIMIGHNDLKYRNVEETYRNIEQILFKVKADKTYFISILPTDDKSYNENVKELNHKIKSLSASMDFQYIDCYHFYADDNGQLNRQYFFDGVHLNIKGYFVLKDCLELRN